MFSMYQLKMDWDEKLYFHDSKRHKQKIENILPPCATQNWYCNIAEKWAIYWYQHRLDWIRHLNSEINYHYKEGPQEDKKTNTTYFEWPSTKFEKTSGTTRHCSFWKGEKRQSILFAKDFWTTNKLRTSLTSSQISVS